MASLGYQQLNAFLAHFLEASRGNREVVFPWGKVTEAVLSGRI